MWMSWQQWCNELFRIQDLMKMEPGMIIYAAKAYRAYLNRVTPAQYLDN